jgi:hypothetical protein
MSTENHEHRIAELERKVQDLIKLSGDLIEVLESRSNGNSLVFSKILEVVLSAEHRNDTAFGLLAHSLPEAVRQDFTRLMARAFFDRDQLAAMLEEFQKNLPPLAPPH